jgi:hypothetical protein
MKSEAESLADPHKTPIPSSPSRDKIRRDAVISAEARKPPPKGTPDGWVILLGF